jgi:cation-transporting ATPase I
MRRSIAVLMGLLDLFRPLVTSLQQSQRRCHQEEGRAHIEVRPGGRRAVEELARRVEEEFGKVEGVQWAELNPHLHRVIVAFDPARCRTEELVALVERCEQSVGMVRPFDRQGTDHPADQAPVVRTAVEAGASAVGLVLGAALKASPLPRVGVGSAVASALSVVGAVPFLRRPLDSLLSERGTDHVLQLLTPVAHGSSQRTLAPLVELASKLSELGEQQARRRVWAERERELCAQPAGREVLLQEAPSVAERTLPPGPVEQYTTSAWQVALGSFGVNLVARRSVRRAVASLLVGMPRPARMGREVFSNQLGRALAAHGILVLEPAALRRLDRVDCLVLQADLVPRQRFALANVTAGAGVDARDVRARARALFVSEEPLAVRQADGFSLGPIPLLDMEVPDTLLARARELGRSGALVLGLGEGGTVRALVEVQIVPQTGVEELIKAARAASMRVVVAGASKDEIPGFGADDLIGGGRRFAEGIRRLQVAGHVVCVVATGGSGLAAADVGVGLMRPCQAPPWGAHLLCSEDLTDARRVIEACVASREASKQSARIAAVSAALGGFLSASGLVTMDTDRAMTVVNVTSLVAMGNGARLAYGLASRPLAAPRDPTPWHALDPEGALVRLSSSGTGLSVKEALLRARPEVRPLALVELGRAIAEEAFNPLLPLLAAGAGMSAFVGSFADAGLVAGVVGFNAVLGGAQRFQVERAVRSLERQALLRVSVLRGGKWLQIDAAALVRGDVLVFQAGDVVPADCRILESVALEVDASSLTGESLPVVRGATPSFEGQVSDRRSMLYEGSVIVAGRAKAVVVATGGETEAQRAGGPRVGVPSRGGVEARLAPLVSLTGPAAGVAGLGLLVAGVLREQRLEQIVGSAVSLAVASVPEGLPVLATAAQLAAARRLSRSGILVRNPRALEALGRINVLCLDKTGTVTEGKLALSRVFDGQQGEGLASPTAAMMDVVRVALAASPENLLGAAQAEAVDDALARGAKALQVGAVRGRRGGELPFDARRGFQAVVGEWDEGGPRVAVKGAPEAILPRCGRWRRGLAPEGELTGEQRRELEERVRRYASRGLRVLAVAERPWAPGEALAEGSIEGLCFRGFLAFSDPVRPSAITAVQALRRAGIGVVLITGDHPSTAEAVGGQLDLMEPGALMTGAELDQLEDEELGARVGHVRIFARMSPAQKVRVVQALQRSGKVVAMAGDGANDASAIRLADVGIAVGERAVAAARNAADLVLTDERIETLLDAVQEGRALWDSVQDAVSLLVGGNLGEVGFTLLGSLIGGQTPLNPRQLLLVNLLTDVAPALAIALRPPAASAQRLMRQGPEASLGPLLYRGIALRSATTAAGAGAAFLAGQFLGDEARARTMGMVALVGTQLGQTLVSGELGAGALAASLGSAALMAGVVQTPLVSGFFGCKPLGPLGWGVALASSAAATAVSLSLDGREGELPWRFERPKGIQPAPVEE